MASTLMKGSANDKVQTRIHLARRIHPAPTCAARPKSRNIDSFPKLEELPLWGFDGSSTKQAEGNSSDCMLKPVARVPGRQRARTACWCMCEVMMPDGARRIPRTSAATILDDPGAWFGFEQEYFLYKDGRPLGFPGRRVSRARRARITPASATRTSARSRARSSSSTSTSASTPASITKASMPRWPRASGSSRSSARARRRAADQMWVARYCMTRLCEKYGIDVEWHCKPLGAKTSIGTARACTPTSRPNYMREVGGKEYFEALMAAFDKNMDEHIAVYGPDNHLRLTGLHETAGDRQVQLWRRRPRRLRPRAAQLRQQRLQGLPRRSPSELAGRPLQDRLAILKTIASVSIGKISAAA